MRQQTRSSKEPAEKGRSGHLTGDAQALLGRGEDPDRAGRPARRGQYRRAVSPRGDRANLYYRWSKDFLEAGKKRLAGDTARAATSDEVIGLRREATALKEVVADLTLENRLLKKSMSGDGEDEA